jgi:hypothetical protein
LSEPDGFFLEDGIYFDRTVFGFVKDDFGMVQGVTSVISPNFNVLLSGFWSSGNSLILIFKIALQKVVIPLKKGIHAFLTCRKEWSPSYLYWAHVRGNDTQKLATSSGDPKTLYPNTIKCFASSLAR